MRFARYRSPLGPRSALVVDDLAHPLPIGVDVLDLLAAGESCDDVLAKSEKPVSASTLSLLPPVTPVAVRDFMTFEQHLDGVMRSFGDTGGPSPVWYEIPTFYFSNPHSLIGATDSVPVPPGCRSFDFELEVAAIIGRDGFNLSVEEARDHILGYTIMNDWSARDLQGHEMGIRLGPAKGKDTATTLGPYLVTSDELEPFRMDDRLALAVSVRVNDEVVGEDILSNMAWSFEELTAYASRGTWVRRGDILGSGTTGAGCLAELWGRNGALSPPPLVVGDVVTMRVDGLGELRNEVVAGAALQPVPGARRVPRERWSRS
jgi:2-keto-4-pentenoate hydratase/2-oxohepta-3-ene-1,7-dioic acid hydratase in catechol pathway